MIGAWLGAGILADVAVTQNFQAVDRFLQTPGSVGTSAALNAVGRDQERFILRRNAGEENNWIFLNWERVELALGGLLFLLLLFGERPQKLLIVLCAAMFLIVAGEHFYLTPLITDLGRRVEDLPAADPDVQDVLDTARFLLRPGHSEDACGARVRRPAGDQAQARPGPLCRANTPPSMPVERKATRG